MTTNLTTTELRIKNFRDQIPGFDGRAACIRGIGEEFGELGEAAILAAGCRALGNKTLSTLDEDFYKEAADIVFVVTGMLAEEGQSLSYWLEKKLIHAENNIKRIKEKQAAKQRGIE